MKNRINSLFETKKKNILSVFYTAGFPTLHSTVLIAEALSNAGADIIEIGIPYSDPVADGPTIQESNKIALENGINLALIIDQVKVIRQRVSIPIILMGYVNPVMQYGIEEFARDVSTAGVDGVILPDLPMDAYLEEYKEIFAAVNLHNAFLISPTTSAARISKIDAVTDGFIYAVAASSITGAKGSFANEQLEYFKRLQSMKLKNPYLIGFGISNHDTFTTACKYGAGAIVGSAFINMLRNSSDVVNDVSDFVIGIRKGEGV
ncbi:MAG: tryptophan synthase subunit alpha [Cyclobacteriaceae bacterium]|nr:tryptophan synthase subunit alpha [Cyclobacteriaceae bacterium]MDH4295798.1 tryptophan synthase subunit alpha [Cyclobacteriaceae bacterium]MDH5249849.1 tryptophan synthase subunit alpha [Cyclobacteriaceae bacterium]